MKPPQESPEVQLLNVGHRYGERDVLRDVTLSVESGTSVAVSGRSGSGKSTLLSIVLGLIKPSTGVVRVSGSEMSSLGRADRARLRGVAIGMVFQHAELIPELSAIENVLLPAFIAGKKGDSVRERGRELLAELGVPVSDVPTSYLSGGERQRTAMARALICQPAVLMADEPTGSLDAELRDSAARLLFRLPQTTGCALLVVTHDPSVARLADRWLTLVDGQLVESGASA